MSRVQKEIHGRIQGSIEGRPTIGTIYKNTPYGVYGYLNNPGYLDINTKKKFPVALRNEIKTGKATIITSLDNEPAKEYEVEIERIYTNNNIDNKSMVIRITDQKLLEKAGGIVQGMSGSPIIQNRQVSWGFDACDGK